MWQFFWDQVWWPEWAFFAKFWGSMCTEGRKQDKDANLSKSCHLSSFFCTQQTFVVTCCATASQPRWHIVATLASTWKAHGISQPKLLLYRWNPPTKSLQGTLGSSANSGEGVLAGVVSVAGGTCKLFGPKPIGPSCSCLSGMWSSAPCTHGKKLQGKHVHAEASKLP